MDYFGLLPEGCLSEILSFTSPVDTVRLSASSKGFKSAAESDVVWEKFFPSDYQNIVSKSNHLLSFSSKKELYFRSCDSPILIDGGKLIGVLCSDRRRGRSRSDMLVVSASWSFGELSFSLDKKTGKKCFMVSARELTISWGDTPHYWAWSSHPDSRFSEVADLRFVCWLDLRGKIETRILSKRTKYVVYLVFKLQAGYYGLETANAFVRFVDCVSNNEAEERASVVSLSRQEGPDENRSKIRVDGWMEIEIGNFFNDAGEDGDVEARLMEIRRLFAKGGLIVQGMEFRPE